MSVLTRYNNNNIIIGLSMHFSAEVELENWMVGKVVIIIIHLVYTLQAKGVLSGKQKNLKKV